MSIQNVFKSLFSTSTRRQPIGRKPATFRPRIEALEDRRLLSTFVVNSFLDAPLPADGPVVTLRGAITAANASPGADQIMLDDAVFSAGSTDTIVLALGQINVTDQLAIDGSIDGGAARVILQGTDPMNGYGFTRILDNEGPGLDLSNLILNKGGVPEGNASLIGGGAIYNRAGALNLVNTDVTNSWGGNFGGGLYSTNGPVTVAGGTFSGNAAGTGGAIFIAGGSLTLAGATIQNNSGSSAAAGIFNSGSGTINNTTIRANSCGPSWEGEVSSDGRGGGILNYGTLTINNSTIAGNTAFSGGGIWSGGFSVLTINNSTITGNTATSGGAIGNVGRFGNASSITITSSTVSDNTAGDAGISLDGGTLTLRSTIVANSKDSAGAAQKDLARAVSYTTINADHSLIESVAAGTINRTNRKNLIGVDPKLGPLADNGGPTMTQRLLAGSPALDNGSNPLKLAYDQRGPGFSRVVGHSADIGAYEAQTASASTATATAAPTFIAPDASAVSTSRSAGQTGTSSPSTSASGPSTTSSSDIPTASAARVDAFFAAANWDDPTWAWDGLKKGDPGFFTGDWLADPLIVYLLPAPV